MAEATAEQRLALAAAAADQCGAGAIRQGRPERPERSEPAIRSVAGFSGRSSGRRSVGGEGSVQENVNCQERLSDLNDLSPGVFNGIGELGSFSLCW